MQTISNVVKMLAVTLGVMIACLPVESKEEKNGSGNDLFHLTGTAFRNKDIISFLIRNVSPDNCDYLIARGLVTVVGLEEKDSKNILKITITPPLAGWTLARVASSDPKMDLLTAHQMMRMEFEIPEEYRNAEINSIEIQVGLCKTPILEKQLKLASSQVQLPLTTKE